MNPNEQTSPLPVSSIIPGSEGVNGKTIRFSRAFYNQLGIKQRRFGMIIRDELSPTIEELRIICAYFNRNPKDYV